MHQLKSIPRVAHPTLVVELAVSGAASLVMAAYATTLTANPLDRLGQVSALASLQLPFAALAILALLMGSRSIRISRDPRPAYAAAFAILAGATSGFVAGGLVFALRGTPYPLFGPNGDSGVLIQWATQFANGDGLNLSYPPAIILLLSFASKLLGSPPEYVLKLLQVTLTALSIPINYTLWRTLLRPAPSLAVAAIAGLVLIDPYKPYTGPALVACIVGVVHLIRGTRAAVNWTIRGILRRGFLVGGCVGIVALVYSGWFVWTAPGAIAAALFTLSTTNTSKQDILKKLGFLTTCGIAFVLVAGIHIVAITKAGVVDKYVYFDALVDPAYVTMWRSDFPGIVGEWPPPGEIGGVSVFLLSLAAFTSVAWVKRGTEPIVHVLVLSASGAWILRHLIASQMSASGTVQLWPRTSMEITYCLLVLAALGAREVFLTWITTLEMEPLKLARRTVTAALLASSFILASGASSISDHYMPANEDSRRFLAWISHSEPLLDGECPSITTPECSPSN